MSTKKNFNKISLNIMESDSMDNINKGDCQENTNSPDQIPLKRKATIGQLRYKQFLSKVKKIKVDPEEQEFIDRINKSRQDSKLTMERFYRPKHNRTLNFLVNNTPVNSSPNQKLQNFSLDKKKSLLDQNNDRSKDILWTKTDKFWMPMKYGNKSEKPKTKNYSSTGNLFYKSNYWSDSVEGVDTSADKFNLTKKPNSTVNSYNNSPVNNLKSQVYENQEKTNESFCVNQIEEWVKHHLDCGIKKNQSFNHTNSGKKFSRKNSLMDLRKQQLLNPKGNFSDIRKTSSSVPKINDGMMNLILRDDNVSEDSEPEYITKTKQKISLNEISEQKKMNGELFEKCIKARIDRIQQGKDCIEPGKTSIDANDVKFIGNSILMQYKTFGRLYFKAATLNKIYDKITDEIYYKNHLEYNKKNNEYEVNEDKNNTILKIHKETRDLLENFSKRNEMFLAYKNNKSKQDEINMKINEIQKEKVLAQQQRKGTLAELTKNLKLSVSKIHNIKKGILGALMKKTSNHPAYRGIQKTELTPRRGNDLLENNENFGTINNQFSPDDMVNYIENITTKPKFGVDIMEGYVDNVGKRLNQHAGSLNNFDSKKESEEYDWINKMIDFEKIITEKDKEIQYENSKLQQIKFFKKKIKTRINDLYCKLQQNPQIMYEKGLFIIDIVAFLKTFGIIVTNAYLNEDFLPEEKDFILKSADLKLRELKLSNQTEEFCSLFSEFDNVGKAKRITEIHGARHELKNKYQSLSMMDMLNKTVKSSEKFVNKKQSNFVKENIIIKQPFLINDFKTNTSYTKWISVKESDCDFSLTKNSKDIKSDKDIDTMGSLNPFTEFDRVKNAVLGLSFDKIKKIEKELQGNLVEALRNRISQLSGKKQQHDLLSIKQRIKYLFNNKLYSNDVYKTIVNNQKFWERKAMCGADNNKSHQLNTANLEKLRSRNFDKDSSKIVGFAGARK